MTIDAMPNRTFAGHVIEIGNTAILRSTAGKLESPIGDDKDFPTTHIRRVSAGGD